MKHKKGFLLSLILTFLLLSCSDKKKMDDNSVSYISGKTAIELEDESIKKGGSSDTTLFNFVFGMTKDQVANKCKILKSQDSIGDLTDGNFYYARETKNFKIGFKLEFFYDNEDKLFRIVEQPVLNLIEKKKKSNPNANFIKEILAQHIKDFDTKPLTNGTQPDAKFYWLKGDKRFDYIENSNNCVYSRSKISAERKIMKFNEELNRKRLEEDNIKDELARKKLDEENIKKEEIANEQRQDEQNLIEKLKAKAKYNWPEDYTTQEYWINEQIEAYHYMLTIPDNNKIKKKAQRNWPLDFTTQRYWYNEQVEAKERLEK